MKDDFTFAAAVFAVLAGLLGVLAFSRPEGDPGATAPATPAAQELRYIEPVNVIGRPETLADESDADADAAAPVKPGAPVR